MRNVLGHSPTRLKGEVAAAAKLVLQAADMKEARRRLAEFVECFSKSAPQAGLPGGWVRGCDDGHGVAGEISQEIEHH